MNCIYSFVMSNKTYILAAEKMPTTYMDTNKTKTVAFQTFGCKLNFAETSTISKSFSAEGYQIVPFKSAADVYVIHSCTVTGQAERKCRDSIKRARKSNPEAQIALIGCYAQLRPQELSALGKVDIVLGNSEKYNILQYVEHSYGPCYAPKDDILKTKTFDAAHSVADRTRSFVKIQDGCDYYCTFCAIPFARGHSRSAKVQQVVQQVEGLVTQGQKEVILTGVNIGTFGQHTGESFEALLRALSAIGGLERIRMGSVEPNLMTDSIIALAHEQHNIMPHFHIPLQSGSDAVLKMMKRKYQRQLFADKVLAIKQQIPLACVAVDVIVGFPGETEAHFEETYRFLEALPVSFLHVFSYSDRPEARAATFDHKVKPAHIKARSKALHQLAANKQRTFYNDNMHTEHAVLWESERKNSGVISGLTDNYLAVNAKAQHRQSNTIEHIRLDALNEAGAWWCE